MGKKEDKVRKEAIVPKSILKDVPSTKRFKLSNGKKVANVPQLVEELKTSGDMVLKVHVDKNKNEIADWIKKEFNHESLAKKIFGIKKKKKMIKILGQEIKKVEKSKKGGKNLVNELNELPDFKNIPMPKKPSGDVPSKKLSKFDKKDKIKKDDVMPPEAPKNILQGKKKKEVGGGYKSFFSKDNKKNHKEIDHLITIKQEKGRIREKKKNLFEKEKELLEKEKRLAEVEKSHIRSREKIGVLKRIHDYDLQERRGHLLSKHGKVEELKKKLLEDQKKIAEDQKKIAEKDLALDELRAKYLDVIKEKDKVNEKRKKLNVGEGKINDSKIEIQKLKRDIDSKFSELRELENNLKMEWNSKFSELSNIKHVLEIKDREIKPLLAKFEQDILSLQEKERHLDKKIKEFEINEKKLEDKEVAVMKKSNLLIKKEEEIGEKREKVEEELAKEIRRRLGKIELKEEKLELKTIELKEKEIGVSESETKLNQYLEKIYKNKELKENTANLNKKLKSVSEVLAKKSKKLLVVAKKENDFKKWEKDLKDKDDYLDEKEKKVNIKLSILGKKEKDYKRQMEDIVEDKFHDYLQQSIKKGRLKPLYTQKNVDYDHNKMYILMDNCRDLIDQGNVDEAKRLYNMIRKLFTELNVKGAEKNILKAAIKELYQEINVATVK